MAIQTADGWFLDVAHDYLTGYVNVLIKLLNGKVIVFKQRLKEYTFYMQPKYHAAGEDLFQQLSRNDDVIKKIFWEDKYIDLADRNKTRLIGISLGDIPFQDYQLLIKKLGTDSRVRFLYNTELSNIQQFSYNQIKIAPTSKVRVEYEEERLLTISRLDDSQDIAPPPFKITHIRIGDDSKYDEIALRVRLENEKSAAYNELTYESFISCIKANEPDIAIIYEDYQYDYDISDSIENIIDKYCNHTVVIRTRDTVNDISLVELVEKARFSYLPMKLASKYRMLRLIDSRITYELLQRNFVIPNSRSISTQHERIRTLADIVDMDKGGMIVSPEVDLHENVAVLDFNDEYANLIVNHNISYENSSNDNTDQTAILPSIVNEIVKRRIHLKTKSDSENQSYCQIRLDTLKQILVCLYGTSGSVWNRYSSVRVFEEINKLSRQILLKTKDIVQSAGFDLIYADTDAVFLKKKNATKEDFEEIKNVIVGETGLDLTFQFHYKYLVLLYIEADEKLEALKHYYGLTYDNQLITRGIDTRRHGSATFIKEFQKALLSKFFDCGSVKEILSVGYENALMYITQCIDKIMNGEVQITDLVISKLLRQNIEKYRSLYPHVAAAIKLNVSGVIANRGDTIDYVYTDSKNSDPLNRIIPAKLISSENYDKEKYVEMMLDSAEAVLSIFGFSRNLYEFDKKRSHHWRDEIYQQRERDIEAAKDEL